MADERERVWDRFLEEWPIDRLSTMQVGEYSEPNSKDCFAYWVEFGTHALGSMRGGTSFKFGVYCRKGPIKEKRDQFKHDDTYSWCSKFGATHEEAFTNVRALVVRCAQAARAGDLATIDALALGAVFKWKVAFLYQDRAHPLILPIFKREVLRALPGVATKAGASALHQQLMAARGGVPIFKYGDLLWAKADASLRAQQLSPQDVLDFFGEDPERFEPIKDPTAYIAGFRTPSGRQIAVVLKDRSASLFVAPGAWFEAVRAECLGSREYAQDQPRNSNLLANAPALALGHRALLVKVPTRAALIALCDAYDESEPTEIPMTDPLHSNIDTPLNQILYGPPGTGKTYACIDAALEILDPVFFQENRQVRTTLKERFDALKDRGDIQMVTFHQSFSYEDFVEGIRAETDGEGGLRYEIVSGVFKTLCEAAVARVTVQAEAPISLSGRRIWKMSLGNTLGPDAGIYDECIEHGYALLGYGGCIDFSGVRDRTQVFERFPRGEAITRDCYAVTAVSNFVLRMKRGDLIVVTEGNFKFRAIGEVTGDYRCLPREDGDYGQCRDVRWLRVYRPSLPLSHLMNNRFSQMSLYELRPGAIDLDKLNGLLDAAAPKATVGHTAPFLIGQSFGSGYVVRHVSADIVELEKPGGRRLPLGMSLLRTLAEYVGASRLTIEDIRARRVFDKIPETLLEPHLVNGYHNVLAPLVEHLGAITAAPPPSTSAIGEPTGAKVLIIDEINRGNVSRIFGELISLIESSKRIGAPESLQVTLPYSKESFGIPGNVYLIGTMNSSDRSLTGLDIALRRRFSFKEMPPLPELLGGVAVAGVPIDALLVAMNLRIEALLGREHCLGHAYFLPLVEDRSLPRLADIFKNQILPLLQEYFFEDWERICWVLNDHRKAIGNCFLIAKPTTVAALFGEAFEGRVQEKMWTVDPKAFMQPNAYGGIIDPLFMLPEQGIPSGLIAPSAAPAGLTNSVDFEGYQLQRFDDRTVKVLQDGVEVTAMPVLRELATKLGVSQQNGQGGDHNTRQLGEKVIFAALQASA